MSRIATILEVLTKWRVVWALLLHAIVIAALAVQLRPDAWFVGDPGIKLFAARSAIAHPSRALESELPPVAAADADRYRQPFFVPHDDHAHAFTSPLFPLLSAPPLAIGGLRGLYILPALGWLLAAPLTVLLARRLGARASPTALWICVAAATPLVFYGLEFWEHTPAVACVLASACLALGKPARLASLVAAGLVGAIAMQLRPEMVWSLAAIGIAAAVLARSIVPFVAIAGGVAIGLAPFVGYNIAHFGTFTGPHVGGNLANLSQDWQHDRLEFARAWLDLHRPGSVVASALIAGAFLLAWVRIENRWTAGLSMLGIVWLALEFARGHELRENLWRVTPIALLAFLPVTPVSSRATRRLLWLLVLLPIAGAILTAPNDGGGQWGPRYLLACVPPLMILALDSVRALAGVVGRRAAWGFVAFVISCGLVVSRDAYVELEGGKAYYSAMAADTSAELSGASVLLTDVWWVPQVSAAVLDLPRALWVDSAAAGASWLQTRPGERMLLVTIGDGRPVPLADWTRGTCYEATHERRSEHGLIYTQLRCR